MVKEFKNRDFVVKLIKIKGFHWPKHGWNMGLRSTCTLFRVINSIWWVGSSSTLLQLIEITLQKCLMKKWSEIHVKWWGNVGTKTSENQFWTYHQEIWLIYVTQSRITAGTDFMVKSIWILIKYFWVNQFNKRFLKTINIRSNSFIFSKNSFVVTYFIA